MTFTFGVFFPQLFFITLLAMINMYLAEKLMIVYYIEKSPTYSKRILHTFLRFASAAPIMLLFFGYWTLGNPSTFHNQTPYLNDIGYDLLNNAWRTDHDVYDILEPGAWKMPNNIFLYMTLIIVFFLASSNCVISMSGINSKEEQENYRLNRLEERGPNFFQSLSLFKQNELLVNELHNRRRHGISNLSDDAVNFLRESCNGSKLETVFKEHTYDILDMHNFQMAM